MDPVTYGRNKVINLGRKTGMAYDKITAKVIEPKLAMNKKASNYF